MAVLAESERDTSLTRVWLPLVVGVSVYVLLLTLGGKLLNDPDTYWHVVMGRWIFRHGAFPTSDPFSFTKAGTHWIAKEWLSQVLYAGAHALGGWAAVAALAAAAIAAAFGLLTRFLLDELAPLPVVAMVTAALVLAAPHLVARPHALAMPVMVAWVAGLVRSVDRGRPPSLALLPVMALWANLHGGFTLGLALIFPLAAEAAWTAAPADRRGTVLQWLRFGVLAGLAACITPYGPESILVTQRVLGLGAALSIIGEWQPQNFSHLAPFELCLLLGIGLAIYRGLTLPPFRILMLLGLLHLALAHVRNAELLGLLGPLLLARPLGRQIDALAAETPVGDASGRVAGAATVTFGVMLAATLFWTSLRSDLTPNPQATPVAAVAALKAAGAGRVLNGYGFGGYLIQAGVAPFIDGRTELYGGPFTVRHHRAVMLQDLPDFLRLLDEYRIDATLLEPTAPAVALLDRLPGWKRIYADDVAVVHRRQAPAPAR